MGLWVELNGQRRDFAGMIAGDSLARLVEELGLKSDRVAVEKNGEIVRRSAWTETSISDGDRLEVVHFVGGGNSSSTSDVQCKLGKAEPSSAIR